ncbi:TetR/AcrR family transcriptional regulator [Nocardia sp. NPDC050712]|uniref:TetR/AcrR family transcriptional regulator n=1 Tax=Nocardia sp. NPDC050712 TaxID=3155518 RepID=UPI0033DE45BD
MAAKVGKTRVPVGRKVSQEADADREQLPARRQDGKILAPGTKGAATRQRLLDAARDLFERQGFGATSVAQISQLAEVSLGTYYQYFKDRSDVMAALVHSYVNDALNGGHVNWSGQGGKALLVEMLTEYTKTYAEHAAFNQVWEEVCQTEPALASVRRELTRAIEGSVEAALRNGEKAGHFPPVANPAATARALCAMADRFCYLTYSFDPAKRPMPPVESGRFLADMWSRAIGLTD